MLQSLLSRGLPLLVMVAALGAAGPGRLAAQSRIPDSRSALSGRLLDSSHAPLPNVAVVLEDLARRMTYRATTDRQGRFEIGNLPAGDYEVEVEVPGFTVFRETLLVVGPLVEREIVLAVHALEETFTVVAGAAPAAGELPGRERTETEPCVARVDPETQSPIGGQIRPPRMLTRMAPTFPEHLRDADLEGSVRLSARITAAGSLADITLLEASHPDFAAAAEDAVRTWTWEETLLNCTPVDVDITVTLRFLPQPP
jgi:TonB family protein